MSDDLLGDLDYAHENSTQRILGSDIFARASTRIRELQSALDDYGSLHRVIADIREAAGVGRKPMLSELAGVIRDKLAKGDAENAALRAAAEGLAAALVDRDGGSHDADCKIYRTCFCNCGFEAARTALAAYTAAKEVQP